MSKLKGNQQGFGVVESILVLVIVILIGVVGYLVYKNHQKTTGTESSKTPNSSSNSLAKSKPDPLAGWQQLCDTNAGLCMKYPNSWKLSGNGSAGYTITSPSGATAVAYLPTGSNNGGAYTQNNAGNCPSDILSITPLTTNANDLDLVQAITNCTANVNSNMTSSTPSYGVISASEVESQNLKAGITDNNALDIVIYGAPAGVRELLYIVNQNNETYTTPAAAQQWFSSSEVQTAAKILNSVSYKT